MKKIVLLYIIPLLMLSTCASPDSGIKNEYNTYINGAWIDDNTFRISGKGTPSRNASSSEIQASAIRSAVHQAQNSTLIKFKEYKKSVSSQNKPRTTRFHTMIVLAAIKNGSIVKNSERFDKRNNCTILFEVKSKNLKANILQADIDSIDIIH